MLATCHRLLLVLSLAGCGYGGQPLPAGAAHVEPAPRRPPALQCLSPSRGPSPRASVEAAHTLARQLVSGELKAVHRRLHPALARQLSLDALAVQWQEIVGGLGALSEIKLLQQERRGQDHAVSLVLVYADQDVALQVVLDRELRVRELRPRAPYTEEQLTRVARGAFERFRQRAWLAVQTSLNPALLRRLPEITAAMAQLRARFGEPARVVGAEVTTGPFGATVELECAFARRPLEVLRKLHAPVGVMELARARSLEVLRKLHATAA